MSKGTVLVLRTCSADMTSYGGFKWPKRGPVKCKDWQPIKECGNGLHGLLWGEGDGSLLSWEDSARWLVVRVKASTLIDLAGKVKFPAGTVVHCGDRKSAIEYLQKRAPEGKAIVGATATAGDGGTATAGYGGTATAGYGGLISILYYDGNMGRYRRAMAEVGESGIEARVPYIVENGKLTKKPEEVKVLAITREQKDVRSAEERNKVHETQ